jgi:hypothetical protein
MSVGVDLDARPRRLRAAVAAVLVSDNAPELRAPRRRRSCWATFAAVGLLAELDAFFTEHHACGDLDASISGEIVWIACPCGLSVRTLPSEHGAADGR